MDSVIYLLIFIVVVTILYVNYHSEKKDDMKAIMRYKAMFSKYEIVLAMVDCNDLFTAAKEEHLSLPGLVCPDIGNAVFSENNSKITYRVQGRITCNGLEVIRHYENMSRDELHNESNSSSSPYSYHTTCITLGAKYRIFAGIVQKVEFVVTHITSLELCLREGG